MNQRRVYVVNWAKFQHYKDRSPKWIKNHIDLLDRDEYLDLTPTARATLHGLWMATARRHAADGMRAGELSRVLKMRVTSQHLEALNHAGFIGFSASAAVPELLIPASPETEGEGKTEKELVKGENVASFEAAANRRKIAGEEAQRAAATLAERITDDPWTQAGITEFARQLPPAAFYSIGEQLQLKGREILNPVGYAMNALRAMVSEGQYSARRSA
jgi:hypothetical protein